MNMTAVTKTISNRLRWLFLTKGVEAALRRVKTKKSRMRYQITEKLNFSDLENLKQAALLEKLQTFGKYKDRMKQNQPLKRLYPSRELFLPLRY